MTYDEYLEKNGVSLPITGFEDLLFDYLIALNEEGGYEVPVEEIMYALYATRELLPHLSDMNSELIKGATMTITEGGESVH